MARLVELWMTVACLLFLEIPSHANPTQGEDLVPLLHLVLILLLRWMSEAVSFHLMKKDLVLKSALGTPASYLHFMTGSLALLAGPKILSQLVRLLT